MIDAESIKNRSPRLLRDCAITLTEGVGHATRMFRSMPDFLIIGTKRGGTTSLHNYLCMHPGVLGPFPKLRGQKSSDYLFVEPRHGVNGYRSHFHTVAYKKWLQRRLGYGPISGESSPYYMWGPGIAARAYESNPRLKAIALIRDPVERAYSHWQERCQNGVEPLLFGDALDAEEARIEGELDRMMNDPAYHSTAWDWYTYRSRGVYLPQLKHWASVFPREQLMVIRSEDMYADVQAVFDDVCRFLGLPSHRLSTPRTFNASKRTLMPENARAELTEYYAPLNRELESYLNRSMCWEVGRSASAAS